MSNTTKVFETKLSQAKELLNTLMNPEITLEASMKAYKEGMELLKEAQTMLDHAKMEYETIKERIATTQQ
ncbi:MAG: hypothetical protein KU37_05120 [Sulfuricurvum sp. PC08-66]|nr:MAG: hypothetical protein KU37_05120 [Sulfuricurvum sp. PC08-66]